GRSGDILLTVGHWLEWTGLFTEVGEAMVILGEQFKTAYMGPGGNGGLKGIVNLMENWSPRYIQLQTTRNHALFAVQGLLALLTAVQIADGASAIIVANDPNAKQNWLSYLLNAVNMASYATSFDTASFGSFSTEDEIQDARRVMAELVNASRYGSGDAEFIVARGPFAMFEGLLGDLAAHDTSENKGLGKKGWEEAQKILSNKFTGTAKLLAAAEGDKPDLDDTGRASAGYSALTTPDALVAKDQMESLINWGSTGDFASVTSTADRGIHCRYKPDGAYGSWTNAGHVILNARTDFKCEEEDRHKWQTLVPSIITKGGMASFLKFAPATNGFEI
ncbi:hypothetical protein KAI87_16035, partial [Myxococcota bacterium]|nr:hypothetical protein [Myxococcota bacterium]